MMSGVIQCFCFGEKRGRVSVHFRRGKDHVRWLLVPVQRGDWRMQRCGSVRRRPTARVGRHLD
jgi:hypothetical protein